MKIKGISVMLCVLLMAFALTSSSAGAESLFSLLATATPAATTASPTEPQTPSGSGGGLFDQLTTATPAATTASPAEPQTPSGSGGGLFDQLTTTVPSANPSPTPSPDPTATSSPAPAFTVPSTPLPSHAAEEASGLFNGLSYSDWIGKEPDRVIEHVEANSVEWIYEQVTASEFRRYGAWMGQKGCTAKEIQTGLEVVSTYEVCGPEADFSFLLNYNSDTEELALTAQENPAERTGKPEKADVSGGTSKPSETTDEAEETRGGTVCSHCKKGYCKACHGAGFFDCSKCIGGMCPTCHGRPRRYSPGYGGVGTGSYISCSDCDGSGKCSACNGNGKIDCEECNGGICRYCNGNYAGKR